MNELTKMKRLWIDFEDDESQEYSYMHCADGGLLEVKDVILACGVK